MLRTFGLFNTLTLTVVHATVIMYITGRSKIDEASPNGLYLGVAPQQYQPTPSQVYYHHTIMLEKLNCLTGGDIDSCVGFNFYERFLCSHFCIA